MLLLDKIEVPAEEEFEVFRLAVVLEQAPAQAPCADARPAPPPASLRYFSFFGVAARARSASRRAARRGATVTPRAAMAGAASSTAIDRSVSTRQLRQGLFALAAW
jgi:hypothetical protein